MALSIISNLAAHKIDFNEAEIQFKRLKKNVGSKEQLFESTIKNTLGVENSEESQKVDALFKHAIKALKSEDQPKVRRLVEDLFKKIAGATISEDSPLEPARKFVRSNQNSTIHLLGTNRENSCQGLSLLSEDILTNEIITRLPSMIHRESVYHFFATTITDSENPANGLVPRFIVDELNKKIDFLSEYKNVCKVALSENVIIAILEMEGKRLHQIKLTRNVALNEKILELCPNLMSLKKVIFPLPKNIGSLDSLVNLTFWPKIRLLQILGKGPFESIQLKQLESLSFSGCQLEASQIITILEKQEKLLSTINLSNNVIKDKLQSILNLSCVTEVENLILRSKDLSEQDIKALISLKHTNAQIKITLV